MSGDDNLTRVVAPGVTSIDTVMAGERELNAVYLLDGSEPCLVETGPGADHDRLTTVLTRLGVARQELAHLVVTHIHMDHAGGAGALLRRYPRATVWVHEAGARHLVDPERLVASTARTYGPGRMQALFGTMTPAPPERVRAVTDGEVILMGDRTLQVLHTPGHASHHIALHDAASGAMFTGEAIGSYLPWADCYRPALPPPEVDVEAALASVRRIADREPTALLTSHFGLVPDVTDACARAAERIERWASDVRDALAAAPDASEDDIVVALTHRARQEFEHDAGRAFEQDRYDVLGSIRMNAQGLSRYWRKRREREEAAGDS
jgi:glyoxylase-like metal-dependent hydrolase (beta-lactamase superfamily II)